MIQPLISGSQRIIFSAKGREEFMKWCKKKLTRPEERTLVAVMDKLADFSVEDLRHAGQIWKYERGTKPNIYVIRRNQVRLYCGMKGNNIIVLAWIKKKEKKASPALLKRVQKLAKEVIREE